MESRAGLAAVKALLDILGAFMSPHLTSILTLLLQATVANPNSPVADAAAAVRQQLPASVPSRLLLPALLGHLPSAVQVRDLHGHVIVCLETILLYQYKG